MESDTSPKRRRTHKDEPTQHAVPDSLDEANDGVQGDKNNREEARTEDKDLIQPDLQDFDYADLQGCNGGNSVDFMTDGSAKTPAVPKLLTEDGMLANFLKQKGFLDMCTHFCIEDSTMNYRERLRLFCRALPAVTPHIQKFHCLVSLFDKGDVTSFLQALETAPLLAHVTLDGFFPDEEPAEDAPEKLSPDGLDCRLANILHAMYRQQSIRAHSKTQNCGVRG